MKAFLAAFLLAGAMSMGAQVPRELSAVRSVDIYVMPYYSANGGKVEQVAVYDKIDPLLASGNLQDFKKAVKLVEEAPQMVTPMTFFVISARAYDLGLRDEAVFWFYVAKNRAITLRGVIDLENKMFFESTAAIGAFIKLVGDVINPYAFCDLAKQREASVRALEWVKAHPYEAIFLEKFPSKHADRKAALMRAEQSLEQMISEQDKYFADPQNLADFQAKRQEARANERFCWK